MNEGNGSISYSVGWDVGGWNCDRNGKSRDALVILDGAQTIVGTSWRGSLRKTINEAADTQAFIAALFSLCTAQPPHAASRIVLAIDTPLGFSADFLDLLNGLKCAGTVGESDTNPYLYRRTERFLFERTKGFPPASRIRPMSPLKDMIGSQATKGMHVLSRFVPLAVSCGVWKDGSGVLTAIEAYPSAARKSELVKGMFKMHGLSGTFGSDDEEDALYCAS